LDNGTVLSIKYLEVDLDHIKSIDLRLNFLKDFSYRAYMKLKTFFLFSLVFVNQAYSAEVLLEDYLAQVKQSNPGLKAYELRAKALKSKIDPAGTWDDPFVAIGKDEIPFDGGMGAVTRYQVSQSIPFPGKLGLKKDIAEYRANSAESDRETSERETALLAAQVFYKLFFNQQALLLNEKIRGLIEGSAESARVRYQTGGSEHHDWLLSRIELNLINVERLRLQRENKTLTASYFELLNQQPAENSVVVLKSHFSNLGELEKPSYDALPELKSLDLLLSQSASELKLAKLSYLPDFVLQGMAMKPDPEMMDEKKTWGFMVGINLPIYFWRKQSDQVEAATLEKQVAELEKRKIENRLKVEELDAKEQFKTAKDVVDLYLKSVIPATELAVQNAKSGYASRKLALKELIETLKVEQTQRLELIAAQIDVELARLRTKNLISSPPLFRFAPSRPSLIGSGAMGGSAGMSSETVNMGGGMSGSTSKKSKESSSGLNQSSGSGMGNM